MSKPMGAIPDGFEAEDGTLLIGGRRAVALVGAAGDTPLFVYDLARVETQVRRFRQTFAGVNLHYAIKANTYAPLLKHISRLVDGLDVASAGEMGAALEAGTDSREISFAGPGKRDDELAAVISAGVTLNLESEGEAERALAIGRAQGRTPRLAIRVNPDFEIKGSGMRMGGGAKPFGVDAARVPALIRKVVEGGGMWRGLHIFAGSQALSAQSVRGAHLGPGPRAAEGAAAAGPAPPLVNLGGGFGIPYFATEAPLDVEAVGAALAETLAARPGILAESGFAIELGRWLVGEAGIYLTRIVDRKQSHGKTFLVTDGGMHHQLAASGNFGQVVRRNYPVAIAGRFDSVAEEEASIVG